MTETTAFLIFKDMKYLIDELSNEELGELFRAIFQYVNEKTIPELSHSAKIIFPIFKKTLDKNEEKYQKICERNKINRNKNKDKPTENTQNLKAIKPKSRESPGNDKTPKKKPTGEKTANNGQIQKDLTEEQARFFERFKELCPNKPLDCQISQVPKVDYTKLMLEIKRSPQYLMSNKTNNLGLRWCLEHSEEIINGNYRQFEDERSNKKSYERDYTPEEMEEIQKSIVYTADNIDELEI